MARVTCLLAVALVAGAAACVNSDPRPHTVLEPSVAALRAQFNTDVERPRVLMIVAPTCGQCLRGVSEMQTRVFSRVTDARLRAYVVWVPLLGGTERDVPRASGEVSDGRATHYWDGGGASVAAVRAALNLGKDAGEMFLLYPPGVTWDGDVLPVPVFWMRQPGAETTPPANVPSFDSRRFLERTLAVIPRS